MFVFLSNYLIWTLPTEFIQFQQPCFCQDPIKISAGCSSPSCFQPRWNQPERKQLRGRRRASAANWGFVLNKLRVCELLLLWRLTSSLFLLTRKDSVPRRYDFPSSYLPLRYNRPHTCIVCLLRHLLVKQRTTCENNCDANLPLNIFSRR